LGQAKLAGILIETAGAQRYAVVGVGLNLQEPSPGWVPPGPQTAAPPAWLNSVLEADGPAVLAAVIPPLVADVLEFERWGWAAFARRFDAFDALRGQQVRLSDGLEGQADGVGPEGALRLLTPAGVRQVVSGELSVRPLGA
jgi:BirA family biotin operon repressor/biotin-[acetyl-CoA-carboxylase] ligase